MNFLIFVRHPLCYSYSQCQLHIYVREKTETNYVKGKDPLLFLEIFRNDQLLRDDDQICFLATTSI